MNTIFEGTYNIDIAFLHLTQTINEYMTNNLRCNYLGVLYMQNVIVCYLQLNHFYNFELTRARVCLHISNDLQLNNAK